MGCGASTGGPSTITQQNEIDKKTQNGHLQNGHLQNGDVSSKRNEKNNNQETRAATVVPAPVAFEVELDDNKTTDVLSNKAPRRTKRLDPIKNAPSLTAEQLEEKLRIAEENRKQELDKKRELSRRTSRLRQNILQAQQFDQQVDDEKKQELEEKQRLADKNREQKRLEIQQKKRMREERMRRAQERARRIKEDRGDDPDHENVDFDLEKDEGFNADEGDDSWVDDGSEYTMSRLSERIYSGRESPVKRAGMPRKATMSASTCDSYDAAFQREPTALLRERTHVDVYDTRGADDFFDT